MQKNIFYNNKSTAENLEIRKLQKISYIDKKRNVDINTLLNRVKLSRNNKKKQQVIFFSGAILLIIFMGTFISIIK